MGQLDLPRDDRSVNRPVERTCPECDGKLSAQSGCLACPACGWSRCAS